MSSADDPLFYGGGQATPIISEEGVSVQYVAEGIILANEFELSVAKPGELDAAQDQPAWLITFKGRANLSRELTAVTLVCDTAMATALIKTMRLKLTQLPIQFR